MALDITRWKDALDASSQCGRKLPPCGGPLFPGEVTMARRQGARVEFVKPCVGMCCWYWKMPDGSRIYHWERGTYESIRQANEKGEDEDAGPCPNCGNPHTKGGTISADQLNS